MFSPPQCRRVRHELVSRFGLYEAQSKQLLVIWVLDGSHETYHTLQQLVRETNLLSPRPRLGLRVWLLEAVAYGQVLLQEALHRSSRATEQVGATGGEMLFLSPQQHHNLREEHRESEAGFTRLLALKVVQEPRPTRDLVIVDPKEYLARLITGTRGVLATRQRGIARMASVDIGM